MNEQIFGQGEIILKKNQVDPKLYFLRKGEIELYVETGKEITILNKITVLF